MTDTVSHDQASMEARDALDRKDWQWLADQLRAWPERRVDPDRTMSIGSLHDMAAGVIESALAVLNSRQPGLDRVTIEAIREPTMHMMQEAGDTVIVGCCNLQLRDARETWQVMIDALLASLPTAPPAEEVDLKTFTGAEARIKQLMKDVGMPNSISLYQAFCQLHKETLSAARGGPRYGGPDA